MGGVNGIGPQERLGRFSLFISPVFPLFGSITTIFLGVFFGGGGKSLTHEINPLVCFSPTQNPGGPKKMRGTNSLPNNTSKPPEFNNFC